MIHTFHQYKIYVVDELFHGSLTLTYSMYKVTQLSWGRNKTMSVMRFHSVTLQWFCVTMVQTSLR